MSDAVFRSPDAVSQLFVDRLLAFEALGQLPEYQLTLAHPAALPPLAIAEWIGRPAGVSFPVPGRDGARRHLHGLVTHAELGSPPAGWTSAEDATRKGALPAARYRVTLRPWLWQLGLGACFRVFQDCSVRDILERIFSRYGGLPRWEWRGARLPVTRPMTVQYGESDLDFVHRLMTQDGLYYWFDHGPESHTLVLCDGTEPAQAIPGGALRWAAATDPDEAAAVDDRLLTQWSRAYAWQPSEVRVQDFAAEQPARLLESSATARDSTTGSTSNWHLFPGGQDDLSMDTAWQARQAEGDRLAHLALARHQAERDLATGLSPCRSLSIGRTFDLQGHRSDAQRYRITATVLEWLRAAGEGEGSLVFGGSAAHAEVGTRFRCRFNAIPARIAFQPTYRRSAPRAAGPQTATVVGPTPDAVHTDEFGRVRVRFHWQRGGGASDRAGDTIGEGGAGESAQTAWVRVAQPGAGDQLGMVLLPRVGDEVVIDFLDGQPDRPLVTGRLFNGARRSPYPLPAHSAVSGWRSRSLGGSPSEFNELRFDDRLGQEYVWLQAQRDLHLKVGGDQQASVSGASVRRVEGDDRHRIGGSAQVDIAQAAHVRVGHDTHASLGGDLRLSVAGGAGLLVGEQLQCLIDGPGRLRLAEGLDVSSGGTVRVGADLSIEMKAPLSLVLESEVCISLKVGASFLTIGPEGVSLSGPLVNINSGGSASTAGEAAVAHPAAPEPPQPLDPDADPLHPQEAP
ncbi:type VI secretion system Vgr family protein [Roseateles amylovorans]|uniref:Type VI secretion system tip protein VgrG n=1 Tax=Roseateles amylovorans TaxID=2978473 RepID=A0ABY6B1U4_9BURK|nr:type VI secretion system tip protein TssI/VgrG [Roseateles amylovorans]UXH78523.1 type VI secretion system tip protein VgrG [Roseateles amylovorans]